MLIKAFAAVAGGASVFFLGRYIVYQIRRVKGFVDKISKVTEENMKTPLTLSNNESVMLMRIKKDFPEFNADVAKQIVSGAVSEYFAVLNGAGGLEKLEKVCTAAFINEIEGMILNGKYKYGDLRLHKTVICDYRKNSEEAVITYQTALEYALEGKALSQHIYQTKYVYYLSQNSDGENASLICQNCGAPISTVGIKVCEYCGAEINASVERTWKINVINKTR